MFAHAEGAHVGAEFRPVRVRVLWYLGWGTAVEKTLLGCRMGVWVAVTVVWVLKLNHKLPLDRGV